VVVLGTIHGDVETSDKIDIRKDAKLVGDIKTARIGIEDGAYFKATSTSSGRIRAPQWRRNLRWWQPLLHMLLHPRFPHPQWLPAPAARIRLRIRSAKGAKREA